MTALSKAKSNRPSLVDQAYGRIKKRILGNRYQPNLRVLEQDLASDLGMSRTPVREALIRLEQEGLVEVLPRRGMRVLPISPGDMREIYEVLTSLESAAAERLAERRPGEKEIAPLIEAVEQMDVALEERKLEAWADADERFHRGLLELAGNRRLTAMALTVFDQVHRARMVTLHMRPLPLRSNEDHRALVQAILKGDGESARRIHREHRKTAMNLLTEILAQHDLSEL